jgi:hypothetical protein
MKEKHCSLRLHLLNRLSKPFDNVSREEVRCRHCKCCPISNLRVLKKWAPLYIPVITIVTEAYCCWQSVFRFTWIVCVVVKIQNKFERSLTYNFLRKDGVNYSKALPEVFIREIESAICWWLVHKVSKNK